MYPLLTRRSFLALAASSASLGAVGHFSAPANIPIGLPPQWELLERALNDDRIGTIDYAHISFAPDHPADLWAILAMLQAHEKWNRPQRVSVIADAAPALNGPPIPFIGTIEINARTRITIDSRDSEPRTSAVNGSRGRLLIFNAKADYVSGQNAETFPVSWKTTHNYTPTRNAGEWAFKVCEALRESAKQRGAVAFSDSNALIPAPLRV